MRAKLVASKLRRCLELYIDKLVFYGGSKIRQLVHLQVITELETVEIVKNTIGIAENVRTPVIQNIQSFSLTEFGR